MKDYPRTQKNPNETPSSLMVGYIAKPHGLHGEARVKIHTDFPDERFAPGRSLALVHSRFQKPVCVTVEASRPHKNIYIVKFREFESIEQIEQLRGAELRVSTEDVHELEEHAYYFHEIIGCEVYTTAGERIGTVKEILQPGANDVWVVQRTAGEKDLYLPYIADVVKRVSPEEKRVVIEWLEGLE